MQLALDRSGQVTVFCGATEIGQGSDDVLAAVVAETLGISTKEVRVISSVFGISSWAQVLSQARRQQNTHVILVLDGTLANRARNLKNQDFFRKNGMTFILTTEAHNLHCVLVAGTDGWIATGPLNSRLLTLPGRIYRMDPKEVELLWQYSTGLIEKGEDGSGTIVDQTGQ